MNLLNLQAEFAESLLSESTSVEGVLSKEHMSIYKNNFFSACKQSLLKTYPLIAKLVGEDYFQYLANDYIKQYPSRSANLFHYGEYFSDFLAECPALKDLIYLSEVALLEWTCHNLQFAADAAPFDLNQLANISTEHYALIQLRLHPACRVIKFYFPILAILELCEGQQENVNLNQGGVDLLLNRRDHHIILTPLSPAEFTFLSALDENLSIANALDAALRYDENFKLEEKLPEWIQNHIIVGMSS